jgi:polysaccharide pyruvyl transferase WcaK-like protein
MTNLKARNLSKRSANYLSIPDSPIKVGLLSNSGCGNLGETATQKAIMQNIQRYWPNCIIYSFAPNPELAQKELGISSFPTICSSGNGWWEGSENNAFLFKLNYYLNRSRGFPSLIRKISIGCIGGILELCAWIRAYSFLKEFDVLIVSGGGQLDDFCFGGRWGYPFTLMMWGLLAKLCNVKYYLISVGAGPLDSGASRLFVKIALLLAQYRSYRDQGSKDYIEELVGFSRNDPVYPDLAHSLKIETPQKIVIGNELKQQGSYRSTVGINPYMGLIMTGSVTKLTPPYPCIANASIYPSYLKKMTSFVCWLVQNNYRVVFLATETHKKYHDYHQVSRDIKDILDKEGVILEEGQVIEASTSTLESLMRTLSELDFIVASRFHCVLLSQLMNKPVLALSFNSKVDLLMEDTGQSKYCLQIDNFKAETLKECFTALETNQHIIKQQLAKRTQEYKEYLNEQYEYLFS